MLRKKFVYKEKSLVRTKQKSEWGPVMSGGWWGNLPLGSKGQAFRSDSQRRHET